MPRRSIPGAAAAPQAGAVASAGFSSRRDSACRPHLHRPSIDLRRLKVGGNPLKMPRMRRRVVDSCEPGVRRFGLLVEAIQGPSESVSLIHISHPLTPSPRWAHRKPLYRPIIRRIMVLPRHRRGRAARPQAGAVASADRTSQRRQAALARDHRPTHFVGAEAVIPGAAAAPQAGAVASAGLVLPTDSASRPHLHRPSFDLRRLKVGGNPLEMPRILQHIE